MNHHGKRCTWGSGRTPTEGHIVVSLRAATGSLVVLRVMDYDVATADDLLGECLVDVDALLKQPGTQAKLQLYIKPMLGAYHPQTNKGRPSTVTLHALPEPGEAVQGMPAEWKQGVRRVRFVIEVAENLPAGDVGGGKDPYVCMYEVEPAEARQGEPLPGPPTKVQMPQATGMVFPFAFQLPANMPSSLEGVPGVDYGYVRCSVYAHLDVAWRADPSVRTMSAVRLGFCRMCAVLTRADSRAQARAFISVVQPVPAALPRLLAPLTATGSKLVYGLRCGWCCDCCLTCMGADVCEDKAQSLGNLELTVDLARRGFAPGEIVPFDRLHAVNATAQPCVLRIQLVRLFELYAHLQPSTSLLGSHRQFQPRVGKGTEESAYTVYEATLPPGGEINGVEALVPLLAPDYHGLGDLREEPIRWRTVLRITLDTPGTPFDLQLRGMPVFIAALAASTAMLPPSAQSVTSDDEAPSKSHKSRAAPHAKFYEPVTAAELRRVDVEAVRTAAQEGVFAKDITGAGEDAKCDEETLTFTPTYFIAIAAGPRSMPSPYAQEAMVDVSAAPPGSMAVCPVTHKQFVVPATPAC